MSQDEDKDSKHYAPSQKKLDDAKKKGQVARSKELSTFGSLIICLILISLCISFFADTIVNSISSMFIFECRPLCDFSLSIMLYKAVPIFALLFGSLFFFLLVGFVLSLAVGGWVFALNNAAPKFSKINPLSGLKRMVSFKSFVELIKSLLKLFVISLVTYFVLINSVREYIALSAHSVDSVFPYAFTELLSFFGYMALAYLLVIIFDVPMQIKQFMDGMKMSLQDIKDEHKNTEGSPEVKAKIKQMQRQAAMSRMMSDVPTADVIVTNPTHYAVALRYKNGDEGAPVVVASGVDAIAHRIIALGDENKILRVESPALARSLYRYVDVGQQIPVALYEQVAQVINFIFNVNRMAEVERISNMKKLRNISVPKEFKYDGVTN